MNLNFIGCFSYTFDSNFKLIDSEFNDGSHETSGPVSLHPYSLYELKDNKVFVVELLRSDFKGMNLSLAANVVLHLD